jgi:phosphomannomutase
MRTLFGTDGIRAKAHEYPLDPATMFALGEALAHRLRKVAPSPRILMGMDTRESGPEIAGALASGIEAGGGEPLFIGVIPTPGVAYLCRTTDAVAGLSISASHNPFEDNGVKIFGHDGMKLADAIEEEIEDELRAIRRDDTTVDGRELTENSPARCTPNASPRWSSTSTRISASPSTAMPTAPSSQTTQARSATATRSSISGRSTSNGRTS